MAPLKFCFQKNLCFEALYLPGNKSRSGSKGFQANMLFYYMAD